MDSKQIDYTFMKTGNDLTNQNELDDESVIDIITLVTTFSQNSIVSASKYVEHANRTVITPKDIQIAMKFEVFQFLERDNQELLQKNKEEITDDYYKTVEEQKEQEFEYEKEIDNLIDNNTEETFCKSICKCEICKQMNYIEKAWVNWEPTTNLEKILKIHISKIM